MKFKNILFWCEFPLRADWKKLNELFRKQGIKARCFIAVESPGELRDWKRELAKYKDIIVEGAWPVISLEKGYWFSGFVEQEEIGKIDMFKWTSLKIDIEPPYRYFKMLTVVNALFWVLIHPFRRAKNNEYLKEKIEAALKSNEVMLSTFPLPDFILRRYGFFRDSRFHYNFMFYTSIIHPLVRPLYRLYYRWFMRHALKRSKETYFAVGLISKGIFNAEPWYKNVQEFKKDMAFLLRNGARNLVVYSLEGISERSNSGEWVRAIKEFSE